MSVKRKHTTLSLEKKCEILKHLDAGCSILELARKYKLGKSTVCDIKRKKAEILKFVLSTNHGPGNRMTLKPPGNPNVDSALYAWFIQERSQHTPISGDILCEKAKYFYKEIIGKDDFKASSGWLDRFKKRHGIRKLTSCEKLSSDQAAVASFQRVFVKKIKEMGLVPDQIYNADEIGLFWRALPKKVLVFEREKSATGRKPSKDKITFMPCANSTGTHKLELLVIGKAQNPLAFKHCTTLPVIYKGQQEGCVTREIFLEWFHKEFVPGVREKMKELNLPLKALLILDNVPGHPDKEELMSEDKQIQTLFFPPNCTLLLQPMDQHVIKNIKLRYRKSLLISVVAEDRISVDRFLKKLDLKTVIHSLRDAWLSVTPTLIQKSWRQLWPIKNFLKKNYDEMEGTLPFPELQKIMQEDSKTEAEENGDINMMVDFFNRVLKIGDKLTADEVRLWAIGDTEEVMFTEELVEHAECVKYEREVQEEVTSSLVKHKEAITAFETCLKWLSENNVPVYQILILRQMREEAFKFHLEELK